jgi:hypothetical protein
MERNTLLLLAALSLMLTISIIANIAQTFQHNELSAKLELLNSTYQNEKKQWEMKRAELESQIKGLQAEIASQKIELSSLQYQLESTKAELENKTIAYENAQKQLDESQKQIELSTKLLENITSQFQRLVEEVNDTMGWFKQNSLIQENSSWDARVLMDRVMEDCVDGHALNLACIDYILQRTATIAYRTDPINKNTNKADHLQSLAETFALHSGDCEDYSLLLKAIINAARMRDPNLTLVAWEEGGGIFRVYPKESLKNVDEYWYYEAARAKNLEKLGNKPLWVVCFPYGLAGHCAVAVGGSENEDLPQLNDAEIFEPQNGQYMGKVGEKFSVCNPSKELNCWSTEHSIIIIISDNDLYKVEGDRWTSYGKIYSQLSSLAGIEK